MELKSRAIWWAKRLWSIYPSWDETARKLASFHWLMSMVDMFGSESFDKTTPLLRMYCLLKPCLYINRPYSNRPPIALVNGVCLCYPHTISASYWANETSQKHLNGNLPSLKLTAKTPKKWMVRIRSLPFWDGLFSPAMLVSRPKSSIKLSRMWIFEEKKVDRKPRFRVAFCLQNHR